MIAKNSAYSKQNLNAIATRALIDEAFKLELLNKARPKRLEEYPLSKTIKNKVLNIKANNLHQFINGLNNIMTDQEE